MCFQKGGVKKTGSLRKVEILRGGELLDTIDFYQLFNQGKITSRILG